MSLAEPRGAAAGDHRGVADRDFRVGGPLSGRC
jgi:hypothetical protein